MRVMFFKIQNAFDSHCHFLATGQVAAGLSLKNLNSPQDVKHLKIQPHHFQGKWLVGFGWDQNQWEQSQFPTQKILDEVFPNTPVIFSRADGHASWLNSAAASELNLSADFKGVLFDNQHIEALMTLPPHTIAQNKNFAEISQKLFNKGGFTHVRDLSMTWPTWQMLSQMSEKNELSVCVESFVTAENANDIARVLAEIKQMQQAPNPQLCIQGVKLFLDGSLGSKTAFISKKYLESDSNGHLSWDLNDVKQVMMQTWQQGLEFAVHTIGDEAVHQVVKMAREISAAGVLGRLHLEHVQIIRPETIQLMKPLHVTCHMQPCHWLSDHSWLKKVLPPELLRNSFSWEALRKNKIPLQFGSDSPIEVASLVDNKKALLESAKAGWPALNDDWIKYHQHPNASWTKSWTELSEEKIQQVYFEGEPLL